MGMKGPDSTIAGESVILSASASASASVSVSVSVSASVSDGDGYKLQLLAASAQLPLLQIGTWKVTVVLFPSGSVTIAVPG